MTFFHKIIVAQKKKNFANGKVISKCKNDKPRKNEIGKVPDPF